MSGAPKETAVSREIMPADGSNPAQRMNGDFGTSPLTTVRLESTAYLSPTGAAKSKVCCHLSNAALLRFGARFSCRFRSSSNCCWTMRRNKPARCTTILAFAASSKGYQ